MNEIPACWEVSVQVLFFSDESMDSIRIDVPSNWRLVGISYYHAYSLLSIQELFGSSSCSGNSYSEHRWPSLTMDRRVARLRSGLFLSEVLAVYKRAANRKINLYEGQIDEAAIRHVPQGGSLVARTVILHV